MQVHSEQFLRKRKFLVVFPLIAVPVLTLLIWVTGIGQSFPDKETGGNKKLNTRLPGPDMEGVDADDKFSLYLKAEKDSLELARQMGTDTFGDPSVARDMALPLFDTGSKTTANPNGFGSVPGGVQGAGIIPTENPHEARIRERLAMLDHALGKATTPPQQSENQPVYATPADSTLANMEKMLQQMPAVGEMDVQLQQAKEVLGSILDVQHPELVKERIRAASLKNKGKVFQVSTQTEDEVVEYLNPRPLTGSKQQRVLATDTTGKPIIDYVFAGQKTTEKRMQRPNVFHELDASDHAAPAGNGITAVIHGTQELLAGATLKMRLTQDIYVQGILIPKGTAIHGKCNLDGERLTVSVDAIRYGDGRYPVALSVYDYDGLPGIRIRDAIARQTTSQGADQALQSMQLYSMDPNLGAQAAAAGMETVKTLLRKKVKLVKTTVKADYPVLLIDTNSDL